MAQGSKILDQDGGPLTQQAWQEPLYSTSPVGVRDPAQQAALAPEITKAAPAIPDNKPGWLASMLGFKQGPARAALDLAYPTEADAYFAKKFQQTYGDPVDLFMQPGTKTKKMSADQVIKAWGDITGRAFRTASATATTPDERNNILKNWIAAQKSSLSALGFDPGVTIMTPAGGPQLTLAGFYRPDSDTLWYNASTQDAAVHESFHRGIQKLRDAGTMPQEAEDIINKFGEEMLVRAFKYKYFGDIEKGHGELGDQQVEDAKYIMTGDYSGPPFVKAMDALESAAADRIGKHLGPK